MCYTTQTLGEFWNVCTRPLVNNGFGLSVNETDSIAVEFEKEFDFLADGRDVHDRWRALLVEHNVSGTKVHDARLAASMYIHGVDQILTLNVRDFKRFPGLVVLHPTDVVLAPDIPQPD
ncbi:MAG: PIN domain nuclease [Candidatus Solibacter usitatus]|nr:PIN domain nuclease [Candidatus Solibacter usitatus]